MTAVDYKKQAIERIGIRLEDLANKERGKRSVPPSETVTEPAFELLEHLVLNNIPRPYLHSTQTGGIQAQWTIRGWDIDGTFSSDGKSLYLSAVHLLKRNEEGFRKSTNIDLNDSSTLTDAYFFIADFIKPTTDEE